MKFTDFRLLLLLIFMAIVTLAPGDSVGGHATGDDPKCDCEDDQTLKIQLAPNRLSLVQGAAGSVKADFLKGSTLTEAAWSGSRPKASMVKSFSISPSTGTGTKVLLVAADDVFTDDNWDQGNIFEKDTVTVSGKEVGGEKGVATGSFPVKVWGTRITWANSDGSVRRWYDGIREHIQDAVPFREDTAQRPGISDGGDTETYYLKLNTDGGSDLADWEFDVQLDKVQARTILDAYIPVFDPLSEDHDWNKYIEKPEVEVHDGIIKVTFKSLQDFPGWSFGRGLADLPFRVVATRKSDGVTVQQPGSLGLYDRIVN